MLPKAVSNKCYDADAPQNGSDVKMHKLQHVGHMFYEFIHKFVFSVLPAVCF